MAGLRCVGKPQASLSHLVELTRFGRRRGYEASSETEQIQRRLREALRRASATAPEAHRLTDFSEMLADDTPLLVFGNIRRLGLAVKSNVAQVAKAVFWPFL